MAPIRVRFLEVFPFHELTPSPSEEGSFVVRAGCRFPSWEG